MAIDKDKPAFARPWAAVDIGGGQRFYNESSKGMTIREAFAMAAMQGLLAKGGVYAKWRDLANDAVACADALIAELNEEQQ